MQKGTDVNFKTTAALVLSLVSFISSVTPVFAAYTPYDGRIQEKQILTPAPAASPRINGPEIYGVRPGRTFLYRIPCQGQRPIQFDVDGLPKGLALDGQTGIIAGTAPEHKGDYTITLKAKNQFGQTSRPLKLAVGEKIALTPPAGWNSWGGQMITVSDEIIRKAADVFVERGLADVGFQYIGIDDCWMRLTEQMYDNRPKNVQQKHRTYDYRKYNTIGPIRDGEGNIIPNGKFPDMKAMCDYVHSKGLKVGIYSSPGPQTCQRWAGSYGHERADADQYARWGFDLLKYDLCTGGRIKRHMMETIDGFEISDFWKPMSTYLRAQDHDILFNLCQYGIQQPWTWAPSINIQSWRIGGDLNHHVENYFKNALRIATELREYSKPGQWNDPDFMYIHRIKDVSDMGQPSKEIPLNTNQRYQYVTLWSVICAPFFFSCDIEHIDDFTVGLLANADVVNINQDRLGHVAEVIRNNENETAMVKNLADGTIVLAVFNRDPKNERTVEIGWDELNRCCEQNVFDVWRQKEIGIYKGGISVTLSPDGVGLFKLNSASLPGQ